MSINITEENFQSAVIDKSMQVPVVVDFWADWCGPCKALGPVLEKLEKDYKGGFVLAKVDTEKNQNIAMAFRISSIPDVRIVRDGKIVDQFVGAIPEKEIKKILDKHVSLPKPDENSWEVLATKNPLDFLSKLKSTPFRDQPEDREDLLWKGILTLISKKESAESILSLALEMEEAHRSFENQRRVLIQFLRPEVQKESLKDLHNLLKSSKDKLEIIEKYYKRVESASNAEKTSKKDDLICIFYLLPPDDGDVIEYRKKLSRLLY